jgi:hypothetical protein
MLKFDHLTAAQDLVRHANNDRDRLLVQLLETMTDRIAQLEARLDKLSDLTVGDQLAPFNQRVLSAIEDNSGEAFAHIEAEIEDKIDGILEGHSFAEAVTDAVQGTLHGVVEEILDGLLHDAIIEAIGDPEDIVRKGLRSIL